MVDDYRCWVPRSGWKTCHEQFVVTEEAGGTITVSITEVPNSVGDPPNSIHIQAVTCGEESQIGDTAGWDRDEVGVSKVLAKDVPVGTCFQLRLSADSWNWFTIEGQVIH
jgi:hypothetical protein